MPVGIEGQSQPTKITLPQLIQNSSEYKKVENNDYCKSNI